MSDKKVILNFTGNENFIKYKNWKGEVSERVIIPHHVWFGSTEYHPEPQWLVHAWDCEKRDHRDFALKDVLETDNEEV